MESSGSADRQKTGGQPAPERLIGGESLWEEQLSQGNF